MKETLENIIQDLKEALRNSKENRGISNTEGCIEAQGKLHTYYVEYKVTECPSWYCTRRGNYSSNDYAYPAEFELDDSDFDFEITKISVVNEDGPYEDIIYEDIINKIDGKTYGEIADLMDFDLEFLAGERDEYNSDYDFDPYDRDDDDLYENKKIHLTENDIYDMVKKAVRLIKENSRKIK